jgi:hypothetical protein
MGRKPDFSGYATKAGLKCSDGRTIMPDAFKAQDGQRVPLVWQHSHDDPKNVLGHAILENRKDGVYAYGFFNETDHGQSAKVLVQHEDVNALSIYANKLIERSKQVYHGAIKEVSLVLSGANPGALIDFVAIRHSDGSIDELEDEAVIYTGLPLEHDDLEEVDEGDDSDEDEDDDSVEHADDEGQTMQEIYNSMSQPQKDVLHYLVGAAAEGDAKHSDDSEGDLEHQEGTIVSNVFEKKKGAAKTQEHTLSHDDLQGIMASAVKGGSLKEAVQEYALAHGIENIETLFPEARTLNNTPEWNKRRTEWVASVIDGVGHSPFSRIKNVVADITQDQARALGYIKGNYKKEEWFGLTKRTTGPTTIYKKQKLDRDDIIDIVDFDVVAWMKGEMRLMLMEEIARAILIGDGRDPDSDDKIKDPAGVADGLGIRSILNENELYATTIYVNLGDANSKPSETVDAVIHAQRHYKGSGSPTFFTTMKVKTDMLLERDTQGHRLYRNEAELANELGVGRIVTVEVMEGSEYEDLVGIIVNLADYNVGADKGGEVSLFDDFDIDYNQYKYLIETRISGSLKKIKSAIIVKKTASNSVLVSPTDPEFDPETGLLSIPTDANVVYKNNAGTTLTQGEDLEVGVGEGKVGTPYKVFAYPAAGKHFESNQDDEWTYRYNGS